MSQISDFLSAVELAAGSVYHHLVAAVPRVLDWSEDHPEVQPLLADGAALASRVLGSVPGIVPLGTAVLAALKVLAAQDSTVQSGH
jgi:hypothetical protein